MNWYLARLVYQIVCGEGNHTPQFDEQWRLIRADEMSWAIEKAGILAQLEPLSFQNAKNEKVQWKFVSVMDICELPYLEDGTQLYSLTTEPEHAEQYLEFVKQKSRQLSDLTQHQA